MHKQRTFIAIAAGVGMLATFLPWVHAPIIGAVNGTAGDGWITFVLFAVALVIAVAGARQTALSKPLRFAALAPAGLAGVLGLWKIVGFHAQMSSLADDNPFAAAMAKTVDVGIGLYLVVVAGVAVPIIALLMRTNVAPEAKA